MSNDVKRYQGWEIADLVQRWVDCPDAFVSASDHERLLAERDAKIAKLHRDVENTEKRVQTMHRREDRLKETIATQAKVIEKLTELHDKLCDLCEHPNLEREYREAKIAAIESGKGETNEG